MGEPGGEIDAEDEDFEFHIGGKRRRMQFPIKLLGEIVKMKN